AFLVFLAQKSFDPSTPSILRVAAISYLSSFISRAAFLDTASLLQCLRLLTAWALQYVESNETSKTYPDLKKDHVFYSVVQAILYIFCFRWQEIVGASASSVAEGQGGYGQLPVEMTGFQRIVMSKFAPLQICTKSIVAEFASITHKLDILYCYNLMAKKSGSSTESDHKPKESSSEMAAQVEAQQQQQQSFFITTETLEAFFPFDPLNLQLSRKFIQASYVEWRDENDEMDADEKEKYLGVGSFGSDCISDALSVSLEQMLTFSSPPMRGNILFTDIFEVTDINKGGKKFDRVSRLNATSEAADTEIMIDINTEIYPMKISDKFTMTLAGSLNLDASAAAAAPAKKESWRDTSNQKSLADEYEYVMFGKVYKYDETGGRNRATVYVSFGGLLLMITGEPVDVLVGQEIYLLMRKNS
ncbi:hypothetical protein HDU98_001386, partial [Podochytrium sp. JEL0797]